MTISLIPTAAPAQTASAQAAPTASFSAASIGTDMSAAATQAPGEPGSDAAMQDLFASLLGAEISLLGQGGAPAAGTASAKPAAAPDSLSAKNDSASDAPAKAVDPTLIPDLAAQIMAQSAMTSAMQAPPPVPAFADPSVDPNAIAAAGGSRRADGTDALAAATLLGAGKTGSDKDGPHAGTLQNLPSKDGGAQLLPFQDVQQQQLSASQSVGVHTPQAQNEASALPATTFTINTPVGDQTWSRQVGSQVLAMVSLKADHAQIQVSPPELGPITVSLKLDGNANTAQVMFSADSAATRDALQNSLPRLTEMMAASGIQLSDAQVSSQSQGQRQAANPQAKPSRRGDTVAVEDVETLTTTLLSARMLSTYA
ncbi:flagellar hook-length control protein FliK [Paludibacterium yongneupense]|uniref:flagellar hook-length control protein FliK n=1 Tax=Paludibacterium yongneupense TaxID=400061 RepID=UPI0003FEA665|nr:flagellar hook-length control protein FliK [Paludibacterium yongneupense]